MADEIKTLNLRHPLRSPLKPQFFNTCQEASPMSGSSYLACGGPSVAVVENRDRNVYLMCESCADHNVRNRGGRIILKVTHGWSPIGAALEGVE